MEKFGDLPDKNAISLISRIQDQGLVIDGAMGTMLMQAGLESGKAPEA